MELTYAAMAWHIDGNKYRKFLAYSQVLYTSLNQTCDMAFLACLEVKVTNATNLDLNQSFIKEAVYQALHHVNPTKAPSSNGIA